MTGTLEDLYPRVSLEDDPPKRPCEKRVQRIASIRKPGDVKGFLAVTDDLKHLAPMSGRGRKYWRIGFISALTGLPLDNEMSEWWQQGYVVGTEYLSSIYSG